MIEPLLLTATRIGTFQGQCVLTRASAFFFRRAQRLYLVTCRHVLCDPPSQHFPDRIEIELHTNAHNLTQSTGLSVLLYDQGQPTWRQGEDGAGEVDMAVIEIDQATLPETAMLRAFTPAHLPQNPDGIEVGAALLIVGFPMGFHDTLHHLPVVRQAVIASSYGLRFQGLGAFF